MQNNVGIDRIHLYIPPQYVDMEELAQARGIEPAKYTVGIGQSEMAVTRSTEDMVSLALNAAYPIIDEADKELIDQIIVATESSFDYSKAAAIYLHEALGIQPFAKAYEMKEACYAGTAALLVARDYVRLNPTRKVLVVTTDIARYGLNSGGEATQGAGAVAMLISSQPRVLALEDDNLALTDNQFDFWRPYYDAYPRVEGKFSTDLYNRTFIRLMEEVGRRKPTIWTDYPYQLFHLPFTKMGRKAMRAYREFLDQESFDPSTELKKQAIEAWEATYDASTQLSRRVGNIYTGSLYMSLISLLLNQKSLQAGEKISFFSYGSGAVAECFFATIQPTFEEGIRRDLIEKSFIGRKRLTIDEYEAIYQEALPIQGETVEYESNVSEGEYYLAKIDQHRRYYKKS